MNAVANRTLPTPRLPPTQTSRSRASPTERAVRPPDGHGSHQRQDLLLQRGELGLERLHDLVLTDEVVLLDVVEDLQDAGSSASMRCGVCG